MKETLAQAKERLQNFREKMQGLSRFQKLLIIALIVAVPAGVFLATILLFLWKRQRH